MSRYENGIHEPTYPFIEAIAKVLKIPPAYFYCADDKLAKLILIYSELPESKRKALLLHAGNMTE